MSNFTISKWFVSLSVGLLICCSSLPVMGQQFTVDSLASLRLAGASNLSNTTITLSPNHGDPHPVTGFITPGEYWINGDHIANPTNSMPIFMELSGTGNTYDLSGATIKLDTRKLDGFGRNLGHDSGIDVVQITGSNNTVMGLTLIGEDLLLGLDPNAQRYADWGTLYVELSGDNNTVDGAYVVTAGSRTDSYGLGDAFGKGSSQGIAPYIGHRKAAAFRVGEATNAVVNDMHLQVNTFGHGFFVQESTNTTLTNSTVTGELFSSQGVIDHPLYQQHGHTYHGNTIPQGIQIAGAEDGVRVYTGASGFTVDNVIVSNIRTGFAVTHDGGDVTISNSIATGVESGFDIGNNTTVINSQVDISAGPAIWFPSSSQSNNNTIELELIGGQPVGVNWTAAYINGNDVDVTITRDPNAEALPEESYVRLGQKFFEDWRDTNQAAGPDDGNPIPLTNSRFINDTDQIAVMGVNVVNNVGSSRGGVISNGKANYYDGRTLVRSGTRLLLSDAHGMGNSGTEKGAEFNNSGDVIYTAIATAATYDDNGTVVENGATLEIQPGLNIVNERVTISGFGTDSNGAIYSDGAVNNRTRLVGSGEIIVLDGDAAVGVGVLGNQLLVDGIGGTGTFTKLGLGNLSVGTASTLDGDIIVAAGRLEGRGGVVRNNLRVNFGGTVAAFADGLLDTPDGNVLLTGNLDLNIRSDNSNVTGTIGMLNGNGRITSSNSTAGAGGTLTLAGNNTDAAFGGFIDGNVTLIKSGDNNQTLSGSLAHTGTTTVTGGGLYINGPHNDGGAYFVDATGTLGGVGVIDASIEIGAEGHLAPGPSGTTSNSTGMLIASDVEFSDQSELVIEIASATDFDQLIVTGTISVESGAVLEFVLADGFAPSVGDQFSILEFDSIIGEFDTFSAPDLLQGQWDFSQLTSDGIVSVVAGNVLLGDCNQDGVVNFNDISSMITTLTTGGYLEQADCNEDGIVDFSDISSFIAILLAI